MKKATLAFAIMVAFAAPAQAQPLCSDSVVTFDTYFPFWKAMKKLFESDRKVARKDWPANTYIKGNGQTIHLVQGSVVSIYQITGDDVYYDKWCRYE